MATATFTTNSNGYDADDKRAATDAVKAENARIQNLNQQNGIVNAQRAKNIPPLAPIPDISLWDISTQVALKTAYENLLAREITASHAQRIQEVTDRQAREAPTKLSSLRGAWADATEAKRQAAHAAALAALA